MAPLASTLYVGSQQQWETVDGHDSVMLHNFVSLSGCGSLRRPILCYVLLDAQVTKSHSHFQLNQLQWAELLSCSSMTKAWPSLFLSLIYFLQNMRQQTGQMFVVLITGALMESVARGQSKRYKQIPWKFIEFWAARWWMWGKQKELLMYTSTLFIT